MPPISHQTALVYAMVTTSAVDGDIAEVELGTIDRIARTLPIFDGFAEADLTPTSQACALLLREDGLEGVLDAIAEALPQRLHETAYALAVEVAAADLDVAPEEIRFLQLLRQRLDIERLAAVAIERGARARYRRE